jgi:hypothetical protein
MRINREAGRRGDFEQRFLGFEQVTPGVYALTVSDDAASPAHQKKPLLVISPLPRLPVFSDRSR